MVRRILALIAATCIITAQAPSPDLRAEEGKAENPREKTFRTVQEIIEEKDLYAAQEYVTNLGDDRSVVNAFHFLVFDFYYKAKSLVHAVAMANAGIQYCMTRAAQVARTDKAQVGRIMGAAKAMASNIASFSWPGWDEKGITITPQQMRLGLEAAKFAMRIAIEQKYGPGKLSFSYWTLGAQLMANRKYEEAAQAFTSARENAEKQGTNAAGAAMSSGYVGLVKILAGDAEAGETLFAESLKALEKIGNKDAQFYAKQLRDVRKVFQARKGK
jgi:hypothetical protein